MIIVVVVVIIITIIIIYNSILCPTKQKKGKTLHYPRCGNSLLNHENISMFNMNNKFQDRKYHNATVW